MNHLHRILARFNELRLLPVLLIAFVIAGCSQASAEYVHLKMGNPSKAAAADKNNHLMKKPYFALSYNNQKGTPNWVSWRLTARYIGKARREEFHPDDKLPIGLKAVLPEDYIGSGFDRGHMCPHGDRSSYSSMSWGTFVMTNIIPQSPNLNQKAWDQLEMYCRDLAKSGKTLYIISGPYGKGGEGKAGRVDSIGNTNTVTVPSKCWKVIMVLNGGRNDDLQKVNSRTRLIAVIMPNDMSVGDDWAKFRVPVSAVEKLTGYKFFDKVPAGIIGPLKKKVDKTPIPEPEPVRYGR